MRFNGIFQIQTDKMVSNKLNIMVIRQEKRAVVVTPPQSDTEVY